MDEEQKPQMEQENADVKPFQDKVTIKVRHQGDGRGQSHLYLSLFIT